MVLVAFGYQDGSVIELLLAERVFSYPLLNRFRPRFMALMVSLYHRGNQFNLVLLRAFSPAQGR